MFYLKAGYVRYNDKAEETKDQYVNCWYVFKVLGERITANVIDQVRSYMAENHDPRYAGMTDRHIKKLICIRYEADDLSYDAVWDMYEFRTLTSSESAYKSNVTFVEL
ncbi:hypothetical protein D3C77_373000 [compost metagenome]